MNTQRKASMKVSPMKTGNYDRFSLYFIKEICITYND